MTRSAVAAGLALAFAACTHAAAPVAPAAAGPRVVALISASAEWKIVLAELPGEPRHDTPFGTWFVHRLGAEDVVFFHGGYGKVAAAGSAQSRTSTPGSTPRRGPPGSPAAWSAQR